MGLWLYSAVEIRRWASSFRPVPQEEERRGERIERVLSQLGEDQPTIFGTDFWNLTVVEIADLSCHIGSLNAMNILLGDGLLDWFAISTGEGHIHLG
jgi:hypothetical protein